MNFKYYPILKSLVVLTFLLLLGSCDETYQPLPVGQMRIELPAHIYATLDTQCPYTIEAPDYARIERKKAPANSCWSNVLLPPLRAKIHMTYRALDGDLARALKETQDLTFSHSGMADNILDERISFPAHEVYGTLYTVKGNVASNIQFYVTDSSDHFLRGALYFNASPNKDSLAPVVDHVHADILHMLESVIWKE